MSADRAAMLQCLHEVQFPGVLSWRDAEPVRRDHATFLDEQLAWCDDVAVAARRAGTIGVGTPADYPNRVLDLGDQRVLVGIRHYGGDPARPFVDVLAWTGRRLDVARTADAAAGAYHAFSPPEVRIAGPADDAPRPADGRAVRRDIVAVAGSLGEMLAAPAPPGLDRVRVADATVDEADAFVQTAYAAFNRRCPELIDRVPPTDRDRLEACLAAGTLAWWTVDGERAGLLAVERQIGWLALDGWLIEEEVAAPAWSGRGTAAAAQRRLAEDLARADPTAHPRTLFGTIDDANLASHRTAARAGRRPVTAWWFVAASVTD